MASPQSEHWDRIYSENEPTEVSWYEAEPASSLAMIEELDLPLDASIIDVGGGTSKLAAELAARGYTDVTVADISAVAIERAGAALGAEAGKPGWVVADARSHDFGRRFRVWHDRATFHFLVDEEDRRAYLEVLGRSLEPGGHVIIATFGPDGPTSCSGLPVVRYGADELAEALAPVAGLVSARLEDHLTPGGKAQQLLYAHLESGR